MFFALFLLLLCLLPGGSTAKVRTIVPETQGPATPGPPLWPTQSAQPVAWAPAGALVVPLSAPKVEPKRTVTLRWTYTPAPGAHLTAAIKVSVDGREWRDVVRTMPGETQYQYETTMLGAMHCFLIIVYEGDRPMFEHKKECVPVEPLPEIKDLSISVR